MSGGSPNKRRPVYGASAIRSPRRRATAAEMQERAEFLVRYAVEHGPVTVRGLYYQAEVHGVPGIGKDDGSYAKVQRQVLDLRRANEMSYSDIADATRWMRKPTTHGSIQDALRDTARFYRKSLWTDADAHVEVWLEKDALAGVIYPVTSDYDVPLMVTRGYTSETFCFEAIEQRGFDTRPFHVLALYDFDRSGQDAMRSLEEKLRRFGAAKDIEVVFHHLGVTIDQIRDLRLPTRSPKRISAADKRWPYNIACELDAIPPDVLRGIVEAAINEYLPEEQLRVLKVAEDSERDLLWAWSRQPPIIRKRLSP